MMFWIKWVWFVCLGLLAVLPFCLPVVPFISPNQTFIYVLDSEAGVSVWFTLRQDDVSWVEVDQMQVDVMIRERRVTGVRQVMMIDSPVGRSAPERVGLYGAAGTEVVFDITAYKPSECRESPGILIAREHGFRATPATRKEADLPRARALAYERQGKWLPAAARQANLCDVGELSEGYESLGDPFLAGEMALYASDLALELEDYEQSQVWANRAIRHWETHQGSIDFWYWAYHTLGRANHLSTEYEQAIDAYFQGLAHSSDNQQAPLFDNLGKAFFALSHYGLALHCHRKALRLYEESEGEGGTTLA